MVTNKLIISFSIVIIATILFTFGATVQITTNLGEKLDQSDVVDSLRLEILVKDKMLYNVREKIGSQEQIYESDIDREKYTIINSPLER